MQRALTVGCRRLVVGAAFSVAAAVPAHATTCFASATALAFGVYDTLLLANDETTGIVTVTCTPGVGSPLQSAYTVTLAGTGTGNDAIRSIGTGPQRLYYQVYKDAARTVVWGNGGSSGSGVAASVTSANVALPASQSHAAYARLGAGQRVAPGVYLGTLLVTVDY